MVWQQRSAGPRPLTVATVCVNVASAKLTGCSKNGLSGSMLSNEQPTPGVDPSLKKPKLVQLFPAFFFFFNLNVITTFKTASRSSLF